MASSGKNTRHVTLPREPIDAVAEPLVRFMNVQASSGVVLLAATIAALALANSAWAEQFRRVLGDARRARLVGDHVLELSLLRWINDGLMVIFFFVVGLEVKRELVRGELREPRQAMLPIAAAIGGMIVPAAIYLALQFGKTDNRLGHSHGDGYRLRGGLHGDVRHPHSATACA